MEFEITNGIYAALIGIFAAVMGIAYPLILQTIEKIDARYDSTRLAHYFEGDKRFKRFNRSLRGCVFFAFVSGFALYFFDKSNTAKTIILAVYSIVTLNLVVKTLGLYALFMNFFYPKNLLESLKNDNEPRLFEILDITCYAAVKENIRLYNDGIKHIVRTIEGNLTQTTISYERDVIEELLKRSSKRDAPYFLRIDRSGIFLYFQCRPLNYEIMWDILRQHIGCGNYDWLMNYWEVADQYYRNMITQSVEKEDTGYPTRFKEDEATRFKEFHIALGALILHHKKTEWLHHIIRFTNVNPPHYDLALCTFRGIFRWLVHFEESLHWRNYKDSLEYKYPILFHTGVKGETVIYHHIVRYLAYSMLHLNELHYDVRFTEPFEPPQPCTKEKAGDGFIQTNENFIQMANMLKQYVIEVNREIKRPDDALQQATKAIDDFTEECSAANRLIKDEMA